MIVMKLLCDFRRRGCTNYETSEPISTTVPSSLSGTRTGYIALWKEADKKTWEKYGDQMACPNCAAMLAIEEAAA